MLFSQASSSNEMEILVQPELNNCHLLDKPKETAINPQKKITKIKQYDSTMHFQPNNWSAIHHAVIWKQFSEVSSEYSRRGKEIYHDKKWLLPNLNKLTLPITERFQQRKTVCYLPNELS